MTEPVDLRQSRGKFCPGRRFLILRTQADVAQGLVQGSRLGIALGRRRAVRSASAGRPSRTRCPGWPSAATRTAESASSAALQRAGAAAVVRRRPANSMSRSRIFPFGSRQLRHHLIVDGLVLQAFERLPGRPATRRRCLGPPRRAARARTRRRQLASKPGTQGCEAVRRSLWAASSTAGSTRASPRFGQGQNQQAVPVGRRLGQSGQQGVGELGARAIPSKHGWRPRPPGRSPAAQGLPP